MIGSPVTHPSHPSPHPSRLGPRPAQARPGQPGPAQAGPSQAGPGQGQSTVCRAPGMLGQAPGMPGSHWGLLLWSLEHLASLRINVGRLYVHERDRDY